jgi:hypothetical protein
MSNNSKILAKIKYIVILSVIVLFIYGGWRSIIGYFNVFPYCNISIRMDILRGDKKSIKKAVRSIRKADQAAYKTLCKYVDRIEEKRCYRADGHIDSASFQEMHEGCYVRGSRTIYIMPFKHAIYKDSRDEVIKALAGKSRNFWESI